MRYLVLATLLALGSAQAEQVLLHAPDAPEPSWRVAPATLTCDAIEIDLNQNGNVWCLNTLTAEPATWIELGTVSAEEATYDVWTVPTPHRSVSDYRKSLSPRRTLTINNLSEIPVEQRRRIRQRSISQGDVTVERLTLPAHANNSAADCAAAAGYVCGGDDRVQKVVFDMKEGSCSGECSGGAGFQVHSVPAP